MASRPVVTTMRWVIGASALLVFGAGAPLMLMPGRTEAFFAFAIDPALTAGFVGSNYWAAAVITGWAWRRRRWVEVRAALPGIFVFTALTGVVSIVNVAQFDLSRAFAWIWLMVYSLFPFVLGGAWMAQRRAVGTDEQRSEMPVGLRSMLGVIAVVLPAVGAGLILYPVEASAAWAWALTTDQAAYRTAGGTSVEPYVGCWLVGIGVVVGGALLENDAFRARPVLAGMVALVVLQAISLVRLGTPVDWSRPQAWALIGMLAMIGGAGAWGLAISGRPAWR